MNINVMLLKRVITEGLCSASAFYLKYYKTILLPFCYFKPPVHYMSEVNTVCLHCGVVTFNYKVWVLLWQEITDLKLKLAVFAARQSYHSSDKESKVNLTCHGCVAWKLLKKRLKPKRLQQLLWVIVCWLWMELYNHFYLRWKHFKCKVVYRDWVLS